MAYGRVLAFVMSFAVAQSSALAAAREDSRSVPEAATLTTLLDQRKLDSVAAKHPDEPSRYVAALYYPGSQLLVVSAVTPVPAVIDQRITEGKYRDAYIDLQGPATKEGRFFVMELGADGLRRTRQNDAPFDITYRNGANQVSYDGDWERQKLAKEAYSQRFEQDDEQYARMLRILADELARRVSSAPAVKE